MLPFLSVHKLGCLLLALMLISQIAAQAGGEADGIVGVWTTAEGKSQVQISRDKDHYAGKIISLKEPNWPASDEQGMGGKPKNDRHNPDAKLRSRPIVGLQLMAGFKYAEKNTWDSGQVYDPESGKTYKGKLYLTSTNQLELRGYVGVPLFGRTEVWHRAPAQ